ncbi:MAG: endonuclease domain-containing protein [Balneolaceae bacterium]|nr:endonuclease domain-containing protein [Balneolaceae bacterium]
MKIYYNPKLKPLARQLRNNSTLAEVLLWNELKNRKMLGYQFMRQKPIGEFIVDFYCAKLKLVIEIDGESHRFKLTEDVERQQWLEELGIKVLRFDDLEVKQNIKDVLYSIDSCIELNQ